MYTYSSACNSDNSVRHDSRLPKHVKLKFLRNHVKTIIIASKCSSENQKENALKRLKDCLKKIVTETLKNREGPLMIPSQFGSNIYSASVNAYMSPPKGYLVTIKCIVMLLKHKIITKVATRLSTFEMIIKWLGFSTTLTFRPMCAAAAQIFRAVLRRKLYFYNMHFYTVTLYTIFCLQRVCC